MRFKVADIIGFGSLALGGLIYMKAKKKMVGIVLIVIGVCAFIVGVFQANTEKPNDDRSINANGRESKAAGGDIAGRDVVKTVAGSSISPTFQGVTLSSSNAANPAFYAGNTTVNNYYGPVTNSVTKDLFESLVGALTNATNRIELTSKQVQLLADALKDLDQRTSGIKKLPDGRTQFGAMISGEPTVTIWEFNNGISNYNNHNTLSAWNHFTNAVNAMETSKLHASGMIVEYPELDEQVYRLTALCAQQIGSNEIANIYAEKALQKSRMMNYIKTPDKMLYTTTLATLGLQYLRSNDLPKAYDFFSNAVAVYQSDKTDQTNLLTKEGVMQIYMNAGFIAQKLGKTNELQQYGEVIKSLTGIGSVPKK